MAKWIAFGFSNCTDPNREEEFVEWYKHMRQADVMKLPWLKTAKMYKNTSRSEGEPRYFTIYELETEEIGETVAELQEFTKKLDKEGRGSELFSLVSWGIYREINFLSK